MKAYLQVAKGCYTDNLDGLFSSLLKFNNFLQDEASNCASVAYSTVEILAVIFLATVNRKLLCPV